MKLTTLFLALLLFTSCSIGVKKIVVFGKGSININPDDKTISVNDEGPNDDKTTEFHHASPLNFTIKKPSGDKSVTISENGLYLVNAKSDTVIGIYQNYDDKRVGVKQLSQDDLKKDIDSLIQLTQNKNISKANHTFFVLPYQAIEITENTDATIVPPFTEMPLVEQNGDAKPEVYRFYNISEIRETITKVQAFTTTSSKNKSNKKVVVIKDKSEQ
jgi:hypothetical protein